MTAGQAWREVWYYQELKVSETSGTWKEAANGKTTVNATANATPLQPGRYRLEKYIGGRPAATPNFIMAGRATNPTKKKNNKNSVLFSTKKTPPTRHACSLLCCAYGVR